MSKDFIYCLVFILLQITFLIWQISIGNFGIAIFFSTVWGFMWFSLVRGRVDD